MLRSATAPDRPEPDARDGEATVAIDRLTVRYPFEERPALRDVSIDLAAGTKTVIIGPSGCGKSTLALSLNGLVPLSIPADVDGTVTIEGRRAGSVPVATFADTIAYVFQDPDAQLCTLTIEDEIAFALENRQLPPAAIDARIDAALDRTGLPRAFRSRPVHALSGGEKQKVAAAAAIAQDTRVAVFDEVTSQLDPASTEEIYRLIGTVFGNSPDRTVLFIDHKLDALLPMIDRVVLLDDGGQVVADAPPAEMFHDRYADVAVTGAWRPLAADLYADLRRSGIDLPARPLTIDQALDGLESFLSAAPDEAGRRLQSGLERWLDALYDGRGGHARDRLLRTDGVGFTLQGGRRVLHDISIDLHGGEVLGIVGRNGAGKSTLGQILAGLLTPTEGAVHMETGARSVRRGLVFQNPEHQFVAETVRDELIASFFPTRQDRKRSSPAAIDAAGQAVDAALKRFGLLPRSDSHPFQLSQGQKRRLSVLAMTVRPDWDLLVLDEPSFGLDARNTEELRRQIAELRRDDRTIVVITHDMDLAAALCDRVAVMDRGRISRLDDAAAVFDDAAFLRSHGLAQPARTRIARWLHDAIR